MWTPACSCFWLRWVEFCSDLLVRCSVCHAALSMCDTSPLNLPISCLRVGTQVDQLPLRTCLSLLLLLETGVSDKREVQEQADELMQRGTERLCTLLKDEAAAGAADADLQAALVAFFGRWHAMLNCSLRRRMWLALPFELLSVRPLPLPLQHC